MQINYMCNPHKNLVGAPMLPLPELSRMSLVLILFTHNAQLSYKNLFRTSDAPFDTNQQVFSERLFKELAFTVLP